MEEPEPFYYFNPDGRGAHAFQTPISMVVEGGFSPFGTRRLHEFDFAGGTSRLWSSMRNPIATVTEYGWGRFLYSEFVPNPQPGTGQWVPNWTWHLIGGGFRTRQLKEYFIHHEYEYPALNAWLVAYTSHLINELIQAERYPAGAVDAIADLYFFDWVGKLIFEIDVVNEVASGTFHLTDWTTQTLWNPVTNSLLNIGQLYWIRFHVFGPLSISAVTGELTNTVNATLALGDEHQLSLGFGFKPHDIVLNAKGDAVADALHLTFGIYYSRNDNPVIVATYESNAAFGRAETDPGEKIVFDEAHSVVVNVYPGWFDLGAFDPGFTVAVRGDSVWFGISLGSLPFGLALSDELFELPKDR